MSFLPTRPRGDVLLVSTREAVIEEVRLVAAALGVPVQVCPPRPGELVPGALAQASAGLVLTSDEIAPADRPPGAVLLASTAAPDDGLDNDSETVAVSRRERLTELIAGLAHASAGPGLGVVGASGGLGSSTLAAALAVCAAGRHEDACLVELEPLGSGFDAQFGTEASQGLRWDDFAGLRSPLADRSLLERLVDGGGVRVLGHRCGPEEADVDWLAQRFVLRALRGESGHLLADLGRTADPRLWPELDAMVLLVGADPPGLVAGARWAVRLSRVVRRVGVVLVVRPGAAVEVAPAREMLGGLPVLEVWRHARAPASAAARGEWPSGLGRGPLARVAQACWQWSAAAEAVPSRRERRG